MITLRTLGAVGLQGPNGRSFDAVLRQPKRLALLFHLATGSSGYRRRDTLFDLFWRDADAAQARAALNQSLYFLRRELGRDTIRSRGNAEVGVEPGTIECDAAAFDAALDAGRPREALELYRGELLPGFFISAAPAWEHWLDRERARLRTRAATAAYEMSTAALTAGDARSAVRWARKATEVVPYDEVHLRRLMTVLAHVGDRAGAAMAYEEASAHFAAEYEAGLSGATRALMERIRSGEIDEVELPEPRIAGVPSSVAGVEPAATSSDSPIEGRPVAPASVGPVETLGQAPHPRFAASGRLRWIAFLAGAALVAAGVWRIESGGPEVGGSLPTSAARGAPVPERLVVLPVHGMGPADQYDDLAEALTDELTRRLSGLAGVGVVARPSLERYREERLEPIELGKRLGARYLVDARLQPKGAAAGLDVALVEVSTGLTLWSDHRDASYDGVPVVAAEIAVGIAGALSLDLSHTGAERWADSGPHDPTARRTYLEGRYLLGRSDEASIREALSRFRAAVDREPTYALAWSGLSDAYDHLAGVGALPSDEAYSRARSAAIRALELEPDLPEAHSALAMALSHHYWRSEAAEEHWRRAIELKPSDARARRTYASHLRNLGRFEEALAHATIARALDPIPFHSHFELLVIPYFQRRYDEVVARASQLADADPAYAYARFVGALALVQLDRFDEALESLEAMDPTGRSPDARLIRGYIAARRGDLHVARAELGRLEDGSDAAARGFERAVLHLGLGEHDPAVAALEEAYRVRQDRLRLLGHEPLFDPLRDDPRFQALLDRIGLGETKAAGG